MRFRRFTSAAIVALVVVGLAACSSSNPGGGAMATGGTTGGVASSGGSTGTAGTTGPGGFSQGGTGAGGTVQPGGAGGRSSGTGGASSSGGMGVTDAAIVKGGANGSGGSKGTGGVGTTGGAKSTGGASATGGTSHAGGVSAAGGVAGTGGVASSSPYKGVANSPAKEIAALGATWCYNWGSTPKATDCSDPYFVPMIWGGSDVAGAIKAIGNAGYTTVLGFNEPNKSDQANMSVESAIALWPTVTSNPKIRVGSPAVSDDGRSWLESFMTQVQAKGLRVDFIAMHWYGWNAGSCVAGQLEGAINWASKWNLPIWITEFGCMGSSNPDEKTVLDFFNNAIPMLKKHPLVERWAWYPWNTYNELYLEDKSGTSSMTALGKAFAAAPQYRP